MVTYATANKEQKEEKENLQEKKPKRPKFRKRKSRGEKNSCKKDMKVEQNSFKKDAKLKTNSYQKGMSPQPPRKSFCPQPPKFTESSGKSPSQLRKCRQDEDEKITALPTNKTGFSYKSDDDKDAASRTVMVPPQTKYGDVCPEHPSHGDVTQRLPNDQVVTPLKNERDVTSRTGIKAVTFQNSERDVTSEMDEKNVTSKSMGKAVTFKTIERGVTFDAKEIANNRANTTDVDSAGDRGVNPNNDDRILVSSVFIQLNNTGQVKSQANEYCDTEDVLSSQMNQKVVTKEPDTADVKQTSINDVTPQADNTAVNQPTDDATPQDDDTETAMNVRVAAGASLYFASDESSSDSDE